MSSPSVFKEGSSKALIGEWSSLADWEKPLEMRETGQLVSPLKLLSDGRLEVRALPDGETKILVADYLL
jgi:hypothetical protein